jgi:hypothetical protein
MCEWNPIQNERIISIGFSFWKLEEINCMILFITFKSNVTAKNVHLFNGTNFDSALKQFSAAHNRAASILSCIKIIMRRIIPKLIFPFR